MTSGDLFRRVGDIIGSLPDALSEDPARASFATTDSCIPSCIRSAQLGLKELRSLGESEVAKFERKRLAQQALLFVFGEH